MNAITINIAAQAVATPPAPFLDMRGVAKTYRRGGRSVEALSGIDLSVARGSFVSVVGRSGCGKSTLLRLIAGLNAASAGDLLLAGETIDGPPAFARCVFQDYSQSLLPWKTVLENVAFGARHACGPTSRSKADERAEARRLLALTGIAHAAERYPWELSGGMQQRVAIARALASQPSLLLMDEPFSSVDALSRATLQDVLLNVWTELKTTILLVTHDIDEAVYLSDRVVVIDPTGRGVQADIAVDLPHPRRQLATREAPAFLEARRKVMRLVLNEEAAA